MSTGNLAEVTPGAKRTATPLFVGYVVVALAEQGVNMSGNTQAILSLVGAWLYYVVARFLEVGVSPKWGYVLGSSKLPVYTTPPAIVSDSDGTSKVSDEGVTKRKRAQSR